MVFNHLGMFLNSEEQRGNTKPDQKEFFIPQGTLEFLGAYGFENNFYLDFIYSFDLDSIE